LPRGNEHRCFICGRTFTLLGDMQKHIVVDHLQEADFEKKMGSKGEVQAA
jgi:hypothetical protein